MALRFCIIAACIAAIQSQNPDLVCNLPDDVIRNIASYQRAADKIIEFFVSGSFKGRTYNNLEQFVDTFGNRIVGTQNLEDAIDYMVNKSIENNLENVHTEEVVIPKWTRGREYATIMRPVRKNMAMLGLGLSVGTPDEGIIAHAVVVRSFDELRSLPESEVRKKIVVYNQEFVSYGKTVAYRSRGASEAAKKGAVGALVRSITPMSLNTPHTGMMSYEDNVPKIPIAAITPEDAEFLWRLQQNNKEIVIKLKMSATLESGISRNTITELQGAATPDKVIIVSGHIDSWDVGDGAMDDGGGAFISWMAPIALKALNLRPKRTLRAILWTAEEVGLIGAKSYFDKHEKDLRNFTFVMESDIGTFTPKGLLYAGTDVGQCVVMEVLKLFSAINATEIQLDDEPGPDLKYFTKRGIPSGGLYNANEKYFWYHHTEADRLSVLDPDTLDKAAAFWAAFAYIIADIDYEIPWK